jgi:hypothetical protein
VFHWIGLPASGRISYRGWDPTPRSCSTFLDVGVDQAPRPGRPGVGSAGAALATSTLPIRFGAVGARRTTRFGRQEDAPFVPARGIAYHTRADTATWACGSRTARNPSGRIVDSGRLSRAAMGVRNPAPRGGHPHFPRGSHNVIGSALTTDVSSPRAAGILPQKSVSLIDA